jgi:hypothetical protein
MLEDTWHQKKSFGRLLHPHIEHHVYQLVGPLGSREPQCGPVTHVSEGPCLCAGHEGGMTVLLVQADEITGPPDNHGYRRKSCKDATRFYLRPPLEAPIREPDSLT